MKILHTSDWHLGQKLLNKDRTHEHRLALEWLLDTIRREEVDVLLVAGDIFDIANPPNVARELYYRLLTNLRNTRCRHVIITGGNHDSPSMLNAPRELLQILNIHVVGAATGEIGDEIIVLRDAEGQPECVVAAVPFLRDRDLRYSLAGETYAERQARLQEAMRQHYEAAAVAVAAFTEQDLPLVAMGHLYATGAETAARQDNIYIGNRENMEARQFPEAFGYVALGHIHRPQAVGGLHHVRYSGSLLPLDFSETVDEKSIYIVEFAGRWLADVRPILVPTFRRLKSIRGPLDKVEASLQRFAAKGERELTPWVEVIVETDRPLPQLDEQLRELIAGSKIDLLAVRLDRQYDTAFNDLEDVPDLEQLDVETVFEQRCTGSGQLPGDEWGELLQTFRELQDWMREQQEHEQETGTAVTGNGQRATTA